MKQDDLIRLRLPESLKDEFLEHCSTLGLTPSESLRSLMESVLDGRISLRERFTPSKP